MKLKELLISLCTAVQSVAYSLGGHGNQSASNMTVFVQLETGSIVAGSTNLNGGTDGRSLPLRHQPTRCGSQVEGPTKSSSLCLIALPVTKPSSFTKNRQERKFRYKLYILGILQSRLFWGPQSIGQPSFIFYKFYDIYLALLSIK